MKLSMETSDLIKLRNRIARERIQKIEAILSAIDKARNSGNKAE